MCPAGAGHRSLLHTNWFLKQCDVLNSVWHQESCKRRSGSHLLGFKEKMGFSIKWNWRDTSKDKLRVKQDWVRRSMFKGKRLSETHFSTTTSSDSKRNRKSIKPDTTDKPPPRQLSLWAVFTFKGIVFCIYSFWGFFVLFRPTLWYL